MLIIAWTIVGLTALFIICNCIKSCINIITRKKFLGEQLQRNSLIKNKAEIIQSLFDNDIEKFFTYKGITFWIYKESKEYFDIYYGFSEINVKNKIAKKFDTLKKKNPNIIDYFVIITKEKNTLSWEFDPIDLNEYKPPKSNKDICIDELNKLIDKQ